MKQIWKISLDKERNTLEVQQDSLRLLIGLLGVFLPLLLYAVVLIHKTFFLPMPSISHYYYTRAAPVFVIVVSLMGIFLMVYKGKKPVDAWLSSLAGLGALLLVLFPTRNIPAGSDWIRCSVTTLEDAAWRTTLHYISASVFLLTLACISMFIFTLSDPEKVPFTKQKWWRNLLYRTMATVMYTTLLLAFLNGFGFIDLEPYFNNATTFWMETFAVEAFGVSWLVKAGTFLKDKPTGTGTKTPQANVISLEK